MKIVESFVIATATLVSVFSISAHAAGSTFRCKTVALAEIGDLKASVLAKCGEPMLKDSFCKPTEITTNQNSGNKGTTVNVTPCENVDIWTYDPGPGQFYTTLQFERGELKAIKDGERVPAE